MTRYYCVCVEVVCTMNTISFSVRGVSLTLLILAAVTKADLHASLAKPAPYFAGLGRLGRDLVRRPSGEETAGSRGLNGLLPPTLRSG
jgi:hypothetical protein